MKRCPKCGRSYDEGMNFCLEDGTPLSSGFQGAIPQETQTTVISSLGIDSLPHAKSSSLKLPLIIGTLVIVFLLFFGGALALIFYSAFPKSATSSKGQQLSNHQQSSNAEQSSDTQRSSDTQSLSDNQLSKGDVFNDQNQSEDRSPSQQEDENLSSVEEKNLNDNEVDSLEKDDDLRKNEETTSTASKDPKGTSGGTEKYEGDSEKANLPSGRYIGSVTNTTFGQTAGLSIRISQNAAGGISGRVDVAKPYLGSGNITSGYADSKIISFISYDRKNDITIYWEGKVKGNSMEGTYTATTSNPLIYPNTQYGVWRVKKAEKR